MNQQFWAGKKVLITGHTGFKGAWLSIWLQHMGATVLGYSLSPPSEPNLFTAAHIEKDMQSVIGDICDQEKLNAVFSAFKPEIVFHLAAQSLVRPSYFNPIETYRTNVMGTLYVLEAMRKASCVRAAVIVTTDKCYENKEWCWGYRENEAMGGHDPYSSSKGCAELLTASYRDSFFAADASTYIATARAGNVIGGGDWAKDRLIPDAIRAWLNNQEVTIRYPKATRPWQHVLEPLSGYLILAEQLFNNGKSFAQAWNFGPQDESTKPVSWIMEKLVEFTEQAIKWNIEKTDNLHEAGFLKLDCSKAKQYLNWSACWNLEIALKNTIDWYKAWITKKDLYAYSIEQINAYCKVMTSER